MIWAILFVGFVVYIAPETKEYPLGAAGTIEAGVDLAACIGALVSLVLAITSAA